MTMTLSGGLGTMNARMQDRVLRIRNRVTGGLPIPPTDLIHTVAGHYDAAKFLRGGRTATETMRDILVNDGADLDAFERILDFGCGVGRIARHLRTAERSRLFGTDYNPALIAWCSKHLTFAGFQVNALSGPLTYESGTFDFIYAFSVLTHLPGSLQSYWIHELTRVLRPGGYLYVTTHGAAYIGTGGPEQQERFRNGQLAVQGEEYAGANRCAAFHPERYVRAELAGPLTVVTFVPDGARGNSRQDAYLLRKPF